MVRPADWFLVELPVDPTPGDAFGIRTLSNTYAGIATIAGEASTGIRHARSSTAASAWIGDAGDVFRDKSERMPGELAKANDSYSIVAAALRTWADAVDDTQAQADRGLQQAREAHADLASAQAALGVAQHSWTSLQAQQLGYQKLQKQYDDVPPPSNVTMPTDYQLRSASRNLQQAQASIAAAESAIGDAESRLAAARRLVLEAKSRRDEAERAVVHRIGAAKDAAVKPSSVWEAIQDSAAWQTIVTVATVVLTILTIVAIFVGGPIVWAIILAATILLVVDALLSLAQGKDAWGELAMLAIGLIPGGRLLGLAGRLGSTLLRGGLALGEVSARVGAVTARVSVVIDRLATGVRAGLGALKRVGGAVADTPAGWIVRTAIHRLNGGELTPEGNMIVARHNEVWQEGPLGAPDAFPADTFRSSTYNEVVWSNPLAHLTHTTTDHASSVDAVSNFWGTRPASGPLSSQLDFALRPEWNVTGAHDLAGVHTALPQATHSVSIRPPLGTHVFQGPTAPQTTTGEGFINARGNIENIFPGTQIGGVDQVFLPDELVNGIRANPGGWRLSELKPVRP